MHRCFKRLIAMKALASMSAFLALLLPLLLQTPDRDKSSCFPSFLSQHEQVINGFMSTEENPLWT
jgi:hypothetical protein